MRSNLLNRKRPNRDRRHPKRLVRLLVAGGTLTAVATAAAPGWSPYVIKSGDTLWDLARANHTTVDALKQQNGLSDDTIYAGKSLLIPGNGAPATAQQAAPTPATTPYVVQPGDTLSGIAKAHHLTTAAIAQANQLTGNLTIYVGQTLALPSGNATGTNGVFMATPRDPSYAAAIAASGAQLAGRPNPNKATISSMVRAEATRQGVPVALALAVADQESGFSQRMVSATNAVGVMQLMPSTAAWIADYTKQPLDRYNVSDNIRGGVTLLRVLLANANVSDSVAGYYQGLASVRANGMYADTKAYVANVLALSKQFS